jgi:hypothetical protein
VRRLRLIVLGTAASDPYAGMAWMHMQFVAGLERLGHEAYYFETTSTWPYDPLRRTRVCDSSYALPYLARLAGSFGLGGRWAYRRSYADGAWFGLSERAALRLLDGADAVLNIAGATRMAEDGLRAGRLVFVGTDPVLYELAVADGREGWLLDEHDDLVTYGENIGLPGCQVPPLPGLRARMRQPVLLDRWQAGEPTRRGFTTVANWKQAGRDVAHDGELYRWSKHHEYLKLIDLPRRLQAPLELATNLGALDDDDRRLLTANGWGLTDAARLSLDPWAYRGYVQSSRAEFTVAKDLNVRLRSGWFSERSACYLAAGRPVVAQDTGFDRVLPVGAGLLSFRTPDEAVAACEEVERDYERHRRAAGEIAEEYFRAETVLARLLDDLGL